MKSFRPRGGYVLFLAMGILCSIVLLSAHYFQYMLQQKRISHKVGEHRILGNLAYSLATGAIHQLRVAPQLLKSGKGGTAFPEMGLGFPELFNNLALPLSQMQDVEGPISLEFAKSLGMDFVTTPLLEAFSQQGDLKYSITWNCKKSDFQPGPLAAKGFSREKKGLIRLKVICIFSKGESYSITEEFNFAVRVKISSLLFPVLSKFAFYVENASGNEKGDFVGFNHVSVNADGSFAETRSKARPLVLDADGRNLKEPIVPDYRRFVDAPRGLVYLGGSRWMFLNLARSDISNKESNSGEGFHCYRDNGWLGFIPRLKRVNKHNPGEYVYLVEMEQGVSDDPKPLAKDWYDRGSAHGYWGKWAVKLRHMKLSSIFRFLGTQAKPTPTLVLGKVMSSFLLARGFTTPLPSGKETKVIKLPNMTFGNNPVLNETPEEPTTFYKTAIWNTTNATFAHAFSLTPEWTSYMDYWPNYGSFFGSRSYNMALAYIYEKGNQHPEIRFPTGDPLAQFMNAKKRPPETALHQIPEALKPSAPDAVDLQKMEKFVNRKDLIERCVYHLPGDEKDVKLWQALERRGLVSEGNLALDGWVFLKKGMKFELPHRPIKFLSSGGFIVEEGDIEISTSLEPVSEHRENCLLGLVTLNGDIIFSTPANRKVQATCIAFGEEPTGGRVIFRNGPTEITGSLAMRRLFNDEKELDHFAGPNLTYFPPLAAIPNSDEPEGPEKTLLTYHFEEIPLVMP